MLYQIYPRNLAKSCHQSATQEPLHLKQHVHLFQCGIQHHHVEIIDRLRFEKIIKYHLFWPFKLN